MWLALYGASMWLALYGASMWLKVISKKTIRDVRSEIIEVLLD
jgi:hypothetical protein